MDIQCRVISVRINFQTTVEELLYFELLRNTKNNARWADSTWLKNYIRGKIEYTIFPRAVQGKYVFYSCNFSPGHSRVSFITLCFNMYTQLFRQDWLGLQKTWFDINIMIIFTLKRSFQYSETNWWQLSNLASFSLQQRQLQHRMK